MNPWLHGTIIAVVLIALAPLGEALVTLIGG